MYTPPAFREERIEVIHGLIRRHGFATLVTVGGGELLATPLPLILDADDGPKGTLIGHVARANPQWRDSAADVPGLAIFSGPDAYISPSWYATKRETGKVVPTWNYATVHARGRVEFFDDPDALRDIVDRLTRHHESARPDPWATSDAPADFVRGQLKGIVGLRMRIDVLEGKWKMSQNRPPADRAGVVAGLLGESGVDAPAVAAEVAERG